MRRFLALLGAISLILAIIGLFLPVLPTVPFVLLAAYCFLRSSNRFYTKLIANRYFGTILADYLQGKGVSRRSKAMSLALLWTSIGIALFLIRKPIVTVILIAVVMGVSAHILLLKTKA